MPLNKITSNLLLFFLLWSKTDYHKTTGVHYWICSVFLFIQIMKNFSLKYSLQYIELSERKIPLTCYKKNQCLFMTNYYRCLLREKRSEKVKDFHLLPQIKYYKLQVYYCTLLMVVGGGAGAAAAVVVVVLI